MSPPLTSLTSHSSLPTLSVIAWLGVACAAVTAPSHPLCHLLLPLLALPLLVALPGLAATKSNAKALTEPVDTDADTDARDDASEDSARFDHLGQVSARLGVVLGYRMYFRYPESPYCSKPDPTKGDDQQKLCGFPAPLALDAAIGFAPLSSFEPFLWGRFGLAKETETNTSALVLLGAGFRLYTMTDSPIKVFLEPAIALEFEGSAGNPLWESGPDDVSYKQDLIFKFGAGPQFELGRGLGLYGTGGLTMGVLRAIHANMQLELGLQGRL